MTRAVLKWVAFSVALMSVALAGAELGLRAALDGAHFSPPVFEPRAGVLQYGLLPDVTIHVRQFGRTVAVGTTAQGHRRTAGRPAGSAASVHLVGDSQTFGWGVADQETIASRLQAKLGPAAVVVNHGVPGYGPIQYRAILDSLPSEDQVIILHTEENDLADTYGLAASAGISCRLQMSIGSRLDRAGCAPLQLRSVQYLFGQITDFQRRKNFTPLEFSGHSRVAAKVLSHRLTRSYAAIRSSRQGRLVLTTIPWKGRYAPQWRATYTPAPHPSADSQASAFPDELDMVAQFAASPVSPSLYLAGDSHLSPAGAERVAQVLASRLVSQYRSHPLTAMRTPQ